MPIDPKAGETESAFMSRCIEKEVDAGFGQEQAVAICAAAWEGRADNDNPVPPKGVQEAAEQGLEYRREYGRGGTDTGIARARDLAAGKGIPPDTLARMRSFFARHEQNRVPPTEKTEPDGGPTNGWIAWQLWGGDAGRRWAESQREDSMAVRIDYAEAPIRMTMTDEGYLTGEARVARLGVQSYQDGSGGVRREYRPASEVFAADAMASFKNTPITMGHPDEGLVTSGNAKRLSVGMVGENIRVDGEWLVMPLTITDAETISRIEGGTVELSGGYMADLDETPGEADGMTYDAIQRDIRGNHVAIVDRARAGEMARLNLDAADAVAVENAQATRNDSMSDNTVAVRIDGIEYGVQPQVERHLSKLDEQIKGVASERDEAKAASEQVQAKLDEANAELEKLKAERTDEAIQAAAKARVALERTASRVLGDDAELDGKTDREIREAVVQAVHADADLADKSDVYVEARFDAAVDTHKAHSDAASKQRETATPKGDEGGKADKRADAIDSIRGAWKRQNSN